MFTVNVYKKCLLFKEMARRTTDPMDRDAPCCELVDLLFLAYGAYSISARKPLSVRKHIQNCIGRGKASAHCHILSSEKLIHFNRQNGTGHF